MIDFDITFCANKNCTNMECKRNSKHITTGGRHSFGFFGQCPDWDENGAEWLISQLTEWTYMENHRKD